MECEGNALLRNLHGEEEDAEPAAPLAKKGAVVAEEDERGVAQVELEGVWGFETKMADIDAM